MPEGPSNPGRTALATTFLLALYQELSMTPFIIFFSKEDTFYYKRKAISGQLRKQKSGNAMLELHTVD